MCINMSDSTSVHIIIVTHNSQDILPTCLKSLEQQSAQNIGCTIVDSGSTDTAYLYDLDTRFSLKIIETENQGFAKANNIGYKQLDLRDDDLVVFMNPDTFLTKHCLENAIEVISSDKNIGVVSGKLLAFDPSIDKATGKIDSTGIFRKWYGRWYDRGQGEEDDGQYEEKMRVPAICGAFMCCSAVCLQEIGEQIFDESFFLYKEDIELSLRLRKNGWTLCYAPSAIAYHCRGWDSDRRKMSYTLRLMSAVNEIRIYKKHPSPYIVWALIKYMLVRVFHV